MNNNVDPGVSGTGYPAAKDNVQAALRDNEVLTP